MRRAVATTLVAAGLVHTGCADTGREDAADETTSTVEEGEESEDD